jgi:hypothetical protein
MANLKENNVTSDNKSEASPAVTPLSSFSNTIKHTPGPWEVEQNNSRNQLGDRLVIRAARPEQNLWDQICEIGREGKLITGLMGGDPKANASLIAAAPDMYEALTAAQNVLGSYILPDSTMTANDCIIALLDILDNRHLVEKMRGGQQ